MAKRTSLQKRKKSNAGLIIGGSVLGLLSLGIVSGIGYFAYGAYFREGIDKKTMCPNNGPKEIKALLIDTTDPITDKTLTDAKNKFKEEMGATQVGGLIEIYGLTENPGELTKMFSGCNPGDGESVDIWTNNPKLQQRRWEEAFGKPLDEVEGKIQQGKSGNQSPIMAAIQSIKLKVFDPYKGNDIPKKLIVMSDMIEHTDLYSQYKSGTDFEAFKASPAYEDFRTSLENISFKIWYINRGIDRFKSKAHPDFWLNWVEDNEGLWDTAIKLEGVNPTAPAGGNT